MNHSILTADRGTHLKVVALAVAGALLVAVVGFRAVVNDSGMMAPHAMATGPAVKAGKATQFTTRDNYAIR
jgi:hypothetical protein